MPERYAAAVRDSSSFRSVLAVVLRRQRSLTWIATGALLYCAPAVFRYIEATNYLPFMQYSQPLSTFPFVPGPAFLLEKLIVNFVAPGGIGAVLGDTYASVRARRQLTAKEKARARIIGSLTLAIIWTLVQYAGFTTSQMTHYVFPSGSNPFEGPAYYPLNLAIAALWAPLAPYLTEILHHVRKPTRNGPV